MITNADANSVVPKMTGRSELVIDDTASLPMPGILKICSVMTAPPNKMPRSSP